MSGPAARAFPLGGAELALLREHALRAGTFLERDGAALYGFGRAATWRLPNGLADQDAVGALQGELSSLAGGEPPGPSLPVAVGALPFRPDEAGELFVPKVAVRTSGDEAHAVVVAESGHREELARLLEEAAAAGPERQAPPDGFELYSARSHEDFMERVAKAVSEVRSGRLEKVVLAREVVIEANRVFSQADLLERLRTLHPGCLTFSVDGFMGASPELLLRRSGVEIASHPLAGTAARSGDPEADARAEAALLSSEKERGEHRAVVEAIAAGLGPVTSALEVPAGPEIVELRNVSHLGTSITGRLAPGEEGELLSALEAVALIHPTPAVAGSPGELALEYLAKEEELARGRYAGPVGWVAANGDGEFHLAIRSGSVAGRIARIVAGVGIVADSDPAAELRETQLKLQAMLAALVRP